jgi:hypothetical protein
MQIWSVERRCIVLGFFCGGFSPLGLIVLVSSDESLGVEDAMDYCVLAARPFGLVPDSLAKLYTLILVEEAA